MSQVLETKGIFKNLEGRIFLNEKERFKVSKGELVKELVVDSGGILLTDYSNKKSSYLRIDNIESAKELRDYLTNSIKLMEKYPEGLKI